jgi:hypothetical protein
MLTAHCTFLRSGTARIRGGAQQNAIVIHQKRIATQRLVFEGEKAGLSTQQPLRKAAPVAQVQAGHCQKIQHTPRHVQGRGPRLHIAVLHRHMTMVIVQDTGIAVGRHLLGILGGKVNVKKERNKRNKRKKKRKKKEKKRATIQLAVFLELHSAPFLLQLHSAGETGPRFRFVGFFLAFFFYFFFFFFFFFSSLFLSPLVMNFSPPGQSEQSVLPLPAAETRHNSNRPRRTPPASTSKEKKRSS